MQISRFTWICGCLLMLYSYSSLAQTIVINEFMSDNENVLKDDDGEFSDWIELYNPDANTVNLNGYYLTDDEEDVTKWKFPNIEIGPSQFLILFASGKDKKNGNFIHTNFKISNDGEDLILTNSEGIEIDNIESIELYDDRSYGRLPDGSANMDVLYLSSPGSSNNESNTISFTHSPSFYTDGFELGLESQNADSIFYTLDGSEPTTSSLLYSIKIPLKDNTSTPNLWSEIPTTPLGVFLTNPEWQSPGFPVAKANVVRCATFKNGIKTSKTYSKTFLIASDVFEKYHMPIVSLITDGSNLFDYENGIYVPGIDYNPNSPEWTGNYFRKDIGAERPVHIEYFDLAGNLEFSQDAGIRIHGGKTRHGAQKSLKLYARKDYGAEYFRYPLMPQKNVDNYQRFLLQTTTGAWAGETVIKDVLAHEIVRDLDIEKMDYRPVIVFLNGEYWGIHHIRDRMDEEYLAYTSGLDIDSLEIDYHGNTDYNALINYTKERLPIDDDEYNYISEQIDIEAFIDYQIAEMFLNNYDWPSNNTRHWRPKSQDGKWRWLFFDIDAGFRDYNYDMLIHNTEDDPEVGWPNNPKFTLLFRALISNDTFLVKFLERYRELIENDFRASITKEKLNNIVDQYKFEMPEHIARWHFPESMERWYDDIDSELVEFLENRSCAVVEHIESFFQLEEYDVKCKESADTVDKPNFIVDLSIAPNPNAGSFAILNDSGVKRIFDICLYNSVGEKVFDKKNIVLNTSSEYTINEYQLPSGLYALSVQEANSSITIPIAIINH